MKLYLTCRSRELTNTQYVYEIWLSEVPPVFNTTINDFICPLRNYAGSFRIMNNPTVLDMKAGEVKELIPVPINLRQPVNLESYQVDCGGPHES